MRALFVTPECVPFAKAGGLGAVSAALPAALRAIGHQVDVLLPAYSEVPGTSAAGSFSELGFEARLLRKDETLFLDCPPLYRRHGSPYQDPGGQDWPDNALRFGLLCKVAAALAPQYDILHCNDWPAALAPVYAPRAKSLLTIHNLAFQGNFERSWLARLGLPDSYFTMEELEFHGRVSFLKGGLVHAGAINTVSPTYAREIQTEEFGCGLEGVLRNRRGALAGILNGVDTEVWDPARDPHLAQRYDRRSLELKGKNKAALQHRLHLEPGDEPLVG